MDWRGRPHDLFAADEVTELEIRKLIFLMTWMRTTIPGQRCRAVFTFNPPGSVENAADDIPSGQWVVPFFAPWLDERHVNPAAPGELRYFVSNQQGESEEVATNEPREIRLKGKVFIMKPRSRTFIPATVQDNAYLANTEYEQTLLAHPEPLRSMMLLGDFKSGIVDHPRQCIPTAWVDEAMDRWTPDGNRGIDMSCLGCDVARGGNDFTSLARRHGWWWNTMIREPGKSTPKGSDVAALCFLNVRHGAFISIDANTVGSSPYDEICKSTTKVIPVIAQVRKGLPEELKGHQKLYNLRSWLHWCMRLILDPDNELYPALPKDNRLRADLIAPLTHVVEGGKLLIESKEEVAARIGHSPDDGDAVLNTLMNIFTTPGSDRLKPAPSNLTSSPYRGGNRNPNLSGNNWMLM